MIVHFILIIYRALDFASQLGGPELEPFYSLIEGGREGSFFAELEEFFYYAQIRRYFIFLLGKTFNISMTK